MKIVECGGQGTALWFEARLGKLTSSRIVDAVTRRKRKPEEPLQAYLDLRMDLAVERVTKKTAENFVSRWMLEGKEKEPLARAVYELRTDVITNKVDFVLHPEMEWCGVSPDGLVGDDGLVEFKCPKSNTHGEYILSDCIPEEYMPQLIWQLACTERQWVDWASYHPDWPEPKDLIVHRLTRESAAIAVMEATATVFLKETADLTMRLRHGLETMLRESLVPRAQIPAWEGSLSDA